VLAVDEGGFAVAAGSGAIRIGKVRTDAGKQDAAAFAATERLKPGDRLTAA
jgi:methionyl-tRNA formyltransferase